MVRPASGDNVPPQFVSRKQVAATPESRSIANKTEKSPGTTDGYFENKKTTTQVIESKPQNIEENALEHLKIINNMLKHVQHYSSFGDPANQKVADSLNGVIKKEQDKLRNTDPYLADRVDGMLANKDIEGIKRLTLDVEESALLEKYQDIPLKDVAGNLGNMSSNLENLSQMAARFNNQEASPRELANVIADTEVYVPGELVSMRDTAPELTVFLAEKYDAAMKQIEKRDLNGLIDLKSSIEKFVALSKNQTN